MLKRCPEYVCGQWIQAPEIDYGLVTSKKTLPMNRDEQVEFETSEGVKVNNTFDDFKLKEDLLRGIFAYGKHFGKGKF